ncbi:hypothetical protein [Pedobacter sp. SYSU D00535]|uniref:hypothetical protein n=1 Tax=Pedobacter sp. SYSU D00535 TaxID=2810308 RepID=UPI001A961ED3|nr:hypothetical protein [Pedobacter sp. SYSU D00535]
MEKHISCLEDSLETEKKEWPILRAGWMLMGVFLLLGILGLFGSGIFSRRTVETSEFRMEYDRYLRYSMSSELVINAASLGSDSSISLNYDYVKTVKIDKIVPEPESVKFEKDKVLFKFSSAKGNNIVFYLVPINQGAQRLVVELNGSRKEVSQYIYF